MNDERRRVDDGPQPGETPDQLGLGAVRFRADRSAEDVIAKARQVMHAIVAMSDESFDSGKARSVVPTWFVNASADDTPEGRERWLSHWRTLDPDHKARAEQERPWALDDWLYWMSPNEREWTWWDARVESDGTGTVIVQVNDWPTATGALVWLLRAAGAASVWLEG